MTRIELIDNISGLASTLMQEDIENNHMPKELYEPISSAMVKFVLVALEKKGYKLIHVNDCIAMYGASSAGRFRLENNVKVASDDLKSMVEKEQCLSFFANIEKTVRPFTA